MDVSQRVGRRWDQRVRQRAGRRTKPTAAGRDCRGRALPVAAWRLPDRPRDHAHVDERQAALTQRAERPRREPRGPASTRTSPKPSRVCAHIRARGRSSADSSRPASARRAPSGTALAAAASSMRPPSETSSETSANSGEVAPGSFAKVEHVAEILRLLPCESAHETEPAPKAGANSPGDCSKPTSAAVLACRIKPSPDGLWWGATEAASPFGSAGEDDLLGVVDHLARVGGGGIISDSSSARAAGLPIAGERLVEVVLGPPHLDVRPRAPSTPRLPLVGEDRRCPLMLRMPATFRSNWMDVSRDDHPSRRCLR